MESVEKGCVAEDAAEIGRRSFLLNSLFAISGAVAGLILAVPLVRFSTYPLRQRSSGADWSDVGPVEEFSGQMEPVAKPITIQRRDGWQTTSSQAAVYVLPAKDGQFRILSPVCPHLGCSIRWVAAQSKFICPCHNGTFSASGERLAGPPRRSMDSLEARVEGGVLRVRYKYFRQLLADKEETV